MRFVKIKLINQFFLKFSTLLVLGILANSNKVFSSNSIVEYGHNTEVIDEILLTDQSSTINQGDTVVFDLSQATLVNGNLEFPVFIISDDPNVFSLDFQFKFNTTNFTYDTVYNTFSLTSLQANFNQTDQILRLFSFDDNILPNNVNLVALSFNLNIPEFCAINLTNIIVYLNGTPCSYKVIGCQNPSANAGLDQTVCSDFTQLTGNSIISGIGTWTLISGSGILSDLNNPNTNVTGLSPGANVFRWTFPATANSPETFDEVTITRNLNTLQANAGPDIITCSSTLNLNAEIPVTGIGTWSLVQGIAQIVDENEPNSLLLNVLSGETKLEWRVSNGSCPETADTVSIFKNDTAYAGVDQELCDIQTTLNANEIPGLSGFWSVIFGTGTFADSSLAITTVTNLSQGINTFQWNLISSNCPDSSDQVSITITCNAAPIIIQDSINSNEDNLINGNVLSNGDFDPDGTQLQASTIPLSGPNHGNITINPDGSFIYTPDSNYYGLDTVIINICDQGIPLPGLCSPDTLIISIQPINDPPIVQNEILNTLINISIDGNVLDNDSDIENTSLSVDLTIIDQANHGIFSVNSDGSFTYTPDGVFVGFDTIVVSVCDSGFPLPPECVNDTIIIFISSINLTVNAGADTSICGTSFTLSGYSSLPVDSSNWTQLLGQGTIVNPSLDTTNVNSLSIGINTFVYTVNFSGIGFSDTIQVNVIENPTPANAGEDQLICGNSIQLQANNPSVGIGLWTIINGTANIENPSNFQTTASNLNSGNSEFLWTITNGICSSTDTVLIISQVAPSINSGKDTSICEYQQPITLPIFVESPYTWSWSIVNGNAIITNEETQSPIFQNLSIGNNSLVLSSSNGPCLATDTLEIQVYNSSSEYCQTMEIFIPEGFSPNGDGDYDVFKILNLNGLTAHVQIFNRWGNLVYESENYQNDWIGNSNQGVVLFGNELPAGTYYYIIQIEGETDARKDYLTLWR